MKTGLLKLKNRYSSEVVYTENYDDVKKEQRYEFIVVYHPENPERKFLVNKDSYEILTK
jgi:hypothetical protein